MGTIRAVSLINVNDVHLYYERIGTGDPLVLVHGSWSDRTVWTPLVPFLSQSFDVVSYDRRGHSDSERSTTQGSVAEDADDLNALIEALELAPAYVVANSFGGLITLKAASPRQELFRRIALHEPPGMLLLADDPDSVPILQQQGESLASVVAKLAGGEFEAGARQFVDEVALGPGTWEQLPPETREMFVRNASTFLDEAQEPNALSVDLDAAAALERPVLLTYGDQSPPAFEKVIDRLATAIPNAERKLIPGAGHVPQFTHAEQYADVLLAFLSDA
jgi:pimeloyl-ACP methyl ester carboxylesterase